MKAISLFTGIGGLDLGLERAGIETVVQAERDPFCCQVLAKHWPAVERVDDVAKIGRWVIDKYGAIDLVHGGFPCQDVSYANGTLKTAKGLEGERSGLWREFVRIVRDIRPGYAIVENVGALSSRGLDQVVTDLAESGYDAEWAPLYAADFGACHARERLFIVAVARLRYRDEIGQCSDCGEQWCSVHGQHWSDCACRGFVGELECGECGEWWNLLDSPICERCGWDAPDCCRQRTQVSDPGAQPTVSFFGGDSSPESTRRGMPRRPIESRIYRGNDGVSGRVDRRWDRIKGVGNAVYVPAAEWIGRRLIDLYGGAAS